MKHLLLLLSLLLQLKLYAFEYEPVSADSNYIYLLGVTQCSYCQPWMIDKLYEYGQINNDTVIVVLNENYKFIYYTNKYIQTKDKAYKKKAIKTQFETKRKWCKSFFEKIDKIILTDDTPIIFRNISNPELYTLDILNVIIKNKKQVPEEISSNIKLLRATVRPQWIPPSTDEIERVIKIINKDLIKNKEVYKLYLNQEYDNFKDIISQFANYFSFFLNITAEGEKAYQAIALEKIINQYANSDVFVFINYKEACKLNCEFDQSAANEYLINSLYSRMLNTQKGGVKLISCLLVDNFECIDFTFKVLPDGINYSENISGINYMDLRMINQSEYYDLIINCEN